uniref:Putative secreted protein n=1 Tax=Anopheles darlingi TaxID=43151 RepID=A0A2M4DLC1_ANODA
MGHRCVANRFLLFHLVILKGRAKNGCISGTMPYSVGFSRMLDGPPMTPPEEEPLPPLPAFAELELPCTVAIAGASSAVAVADAFQCGKNDSIIIKQ